MRRIPYAPRADSGQAGGAVAPRRHVAPLNAEDRVPGRGSRKRRLLSQGRARQTQTRPWPAGIIFPRPGLESDGHRRRKDSTKAHGMRAVKIRRPSDWGSGRSCSRNGKSSRRARRLASQAVVSWSGLTKLIVGAKAVGVVTRLRLKLMAIPHGSGDRARLFDCSKRTVKRSAVTVGQSLGDRDPGRARSERSNCIDRRSLPRWNHAAGEVEVDGNPRRSRGRRRIVESLRRGPPARGQTATRIDALWRRARSSEPPWEPCDRVRRAEYCGEDIAVPVRIPRRCAHQD